MLSSFYSPHSKTLTARHRQHDTDLWPMERLCPTQCARSHVQASDVNQHQHGGRFAENTKCPVCTTEQPEEIVHQALEQESLALQRTHSESLAHKVDMPMPCRGPALPQVAALLFGAPHSRVVPGWGAS